MANIKNVLSAIIDIQDKTISKLKYSNNALITISGAVNSISEQINNISVNANLENYYNKDEVDQLINNSISEELDPKFAAVSRTVCNKNRDF